MSTIYDICRELTKKGPWKGLKVDLSCANLSSDEKTSLAQWVNSKIVKATDLAEFFNLNVNTLRSYALKHSKGIILKEDGGRRKIISPNDFKENVIDVIQQAGKKRIRANKLNSLLTNAQNASQRQLGQVVDKKHLEMSEKTKQRYIKQFGVKTKMAESMKSRGP